MPERIIVWQPDEPGDVCPLDGSPVYRGDKRPANETRVKDQVSCLGCPHLAAREDGKGLRYEGQLLYVECGYELDALPQGLAPLTAEEQAAPEPAAEPAAAEVPAPPTGRIGGEPYRGNQGRDRGLDILAAMGYPTINCPVCGPKRTCPREHDPSRPCRQR
jgi:hypothetical protein